MTRKHFLSLAALLASATAFAALTPAHAQRRTPSEAPVSTTDYFGDKPPPKDQPGPQSLRPVSGEEDARPGVADVSKEPPAPTKARSIRRDPAAQPTPKP